TQSFIQSVSHSLSNSLFSHSFNSSFTPLQIVVTIYSFILNSIALLTHSSSDRRASLRASVTSLGGRTWRAGVALPPKPNSPSSTCLAAILYVNDFTHS